MTTNTMARKAMIAETLQSIIAALAELQNKRIQIPLYLLGDLHTIDEQLWNIVDLCDETEADR